MTVAMMGAHKHFLTYKRTPVHTYIHTYIHTGQQMDTSMYAFSLRNTHNLFQFQVGDLLRGLALQLAHGIEPEVAYPHTHTYIHTYIQHLQIHTYCM